MIEHLHLILSGEPGEPLIVHNGLLADRSYEWTRKLAEVTGKRNKTDEDHDLVAELEWNGSLYFDDNAGPYLPGDNIRRCLLDAARLTKDGKRIERGVLRVSRLNVLEYDGPRTRPDLWADSRFRHRAMVKVGTSKVARTRPKFTDWSCPAEVVYDTTILDERDLLRIAEAAGQYIGIGDGRPFFGGRFNVKQA